jgi:ankyrin repeat protein
MAEAADVFKAIDKDDTRRLKALLKKEPALAEAQNEQGISAVLYARYRSADKALDALLAAQPGLSVFEAAAVGDVKRIRELLETNRSLVESYTPDGFTALHLAAFFGQPEAAGLLLENDAPVNAVATNQMKVTPLHSAVAANDAKISRLLVENNAEINVSQQMGYTPLHEAAQNGNVEIARMLLENGADAKARMDDGTTPAELARKHRHAKLAEMIGEFEQ